MTEIRSYRRVFDLERRIYNVQELRLNPGGVPVRGVVYFLVILCVGLLAARVPVMGELAVRMPWYLRDILLPGATATLLGAIRLEGRTFHLAMRAVVRLCLQPRASAGMRGCPSVGARWRPREIVLMPDGSDGRLRGLRYRGPGAVLVAVAHERRGRASERGGSGLARPGMRATLTIVEPRRERGAQRGQVITLGAGARVLVRPSRRARR